MLTTKDYLLSLLNRQGYIAISQAARDFQVSRQCVSQTLQSMEKKGLVVREGKVYRAPGKTVQVPPTFGDREDRLRAARDEIMGHIKSRGWFKSGIFRSSVSPSVVRRALFELSSYGVLKHHFEGFYTLKGEQLPSSAPLKDRRDPNSKSSILRSKFLEMAASGPVRYIDLMRSSGCSRELTASFLREGVDRGHILKIERGLYRLAEGVSGF